MNKILMIKDNLIYNNRMVLLKPTWNTRDVVILYTKNGQNPLEVDAFSTKSFIPIDRSCTVRFVGIKSDNYASPVYELTLNMVDQHSSRQVQEVTSTSFVQQGVRREMYSNTSNISLSDGTSTRGRYVPNKLLNNLSFNKVITVSGHLIDRIDLIAYEYLGNSELWWVIAECNRSSIIDPTNIPSGTKIAIPDIETLYQRGILSRYTSRSDLAVLDQY